MALSNVNFFKTIKINSINFENKISYKIVYYVIIRPPLHQVKLVKSLFLDYLFLGSMQFF